MNRIFVNRVIFKTPDGCLIMDRNPDIMEWWEDDFDYVYGKFAAERGVKIISKTIVNKVANCIVDYMR